MFADLLINLPADMPSTVVAAVVTPSEMEIEVIGAAGPTEDTLYEIGSITKVFTVMTAVSLEAGEGELSLDDPVSDYWEGAPEEIQLRHLANHTSGLKRLPGNMGYRWLKQHEEQPYAAYDRVLLAEAVSKARTRGKPGEKARYSNFGMGLLGETLALSMGRSYQSLVNEKVLQPLGLTATGFDGEPLQPHDRKGEPVPAWGFDALAGCGALRSTVRDMATFARWWMEPEPPFDRMFDQGLGWQVHEGEDDEYFWHNGGTAGSASFIAVDPERDLAVVLIWNQSDPLGLRITAAGMNAMRILQD